MFQMGVMQPRCSWGSPTLGSLGNLDLNPNSTAYDITRLPHGCSMALTSSSTSCFVLAQVNAEAKPSPSTKFHKQSTHTDSFINLAMLLKMGSGRYRRSGSHPASSSSISSISPPLFPLVHIYIPPLSHMRETSQPQPKHLLYFSSKDRLPILRGILKMFSHSHYSYEY